MLGLSYQDPSTIAELRSEELTLLQGKRRRSLHYFSEEIQVRVLAIRKEIKGIRIEALSHFIDALKTRRSQLPAFRKVVTLTFAFSAAAFLCTLSEEQERGGMGREFANNASVFFSIMSAVGTVTILYAYLLNTQLEKLQAIRANLQQQLEYNDY